MAGIRFGKMKSLASLVSPNSSSLTSSFHNTHMKSGVFPDSDSIHVRISFGALGHNYHTKNRIRNSNVKPRASGQFSKPCYGSTFSPTLLNYKVLSSFPLGKTTPMSGYLSYSSFAGGKGDHIGKGSQVSGIGEGGSDSGIVGGDWVDKLKDGWQTVVNSVNVTTEKAKETSDQLTPHVQKVLDSNPYLKDNVVPFGGALTAAILVWVALPRFLKYLHTYSTKGSVALLSRTGIDVGVPYEKSGWAALQDPVCYLMTFLAFSQMLVTNASIYCRTWFFDTPANIQCVSIYSLLSIYIVLI